MKQSFLSSPRGRRNTVAILVLAACIPALVQVRIRAGLDRCPAWTARSVIHALVLEALELVNPVYAHLTTESRQSRKDLVVALHGGHGPGPATSGSDSGAGGTRAGASGDSAVVATGDTCRPGGSVNILMISNQNGPNEDPTKWFTFHVFQITLDPMTMRVVTIPGSYPVRLRGGAASTVLRCYLDSGIAALRGELRRTCGCGPIDYHLCLSSNKTSAILAALGLTEERRQLDRILAMHGRELPENVLAEETGLFARNMFLHVLPRLDGLSGELLVGSGLRLIDSNIPRDVCLGLIYALNDHHVPEHPEKAVHTVLGY